MDYKQEQFMRMQQYQYAPQMPFYMSYPIQNVYMTELEYERDMERMKELYPEEAKRIQKLVEEECDKMEYEGSMMFDEYPDRVTLKVICDRIGQLASQPQEQAEAEPEQVTEKETAEKPENESVKIHGLYSLANCACLEVHIEEGYDPFIMWRLSIVDSEKPQKWHKAKIYDTAKGRQYFKYGKIRIYLDEVMRGYKRQHWHK